MPQAKDPAERQWLAQLEELGAWVREHRCLPTQSAPTPGPGLAAWLDLQLLRLTGGQLEGWKVEHLERSGYVPRRGGAQAPDIVHGPDSAYGRSWLQAFSTHRRVLDAVRGELSLAEGGKDVDAALDWFRTQLRRHGKGSLPEWKQEQLRRHAPGALEGRRYKVSSFDRSMTRLRAHIASHGALPHGSAKDPDTVGLLSWMRRTEAAIAAGTVHEEDVTAFRSALAHVPSRHEAKWRARLADIARFVESEARLPGDAPTPGQALGPSESADRRWLQKLRVSLLKGEVEDGRMERLRATPLRLREYLGAPGA